jgi:hypothetical protein
MASRSDQIAIPIGSYKNRENLIFLKFQFQFICFLAYTKFNYIYNKYITIDKVSHSILYIREKINNFNPDESVSIQKIVKNLLLQSFNFYVEK